MTDVPNRLTTLVVNGETFSAPARPDVTLLAFLRQQAGLTGTKEACGRGECGACTVLVDGDPIMSCITLAARVTGAVRTVEGIADEFADLREAFADTGGFQCGFCTPGQIVRAAALVASGFDGTTEELRLAMSGNICRCTGYVAIVDAVQRVLDERAAS